jgi:hypothetical protein
MRVHILMIVAVLALVGGCSVEIQGSAGPATTLTKAPAPRQTPTADPTAPHHKIEIRLFVADKFHSSALLSANNRQDGISDAATAKRVWQDPALATDRAAQQRAADSMNCFQDNPLRGQDDPKLPLATCAPDVKVAVLAPTLLSADMITGASYGVSDDPAQGGTVWVSLTPAGGKIVAEMAPKNVDVLLALLFDTTVVSSLTVTEKLTAPLAFRFPTTREAGAAATVVANR